MNELWKDVVGYEGFYEVSNFGKIKSHYRKGKIKSHYRKGNILIPHLSQHGYYQVSLHKGGVGKLTSVHRIVLIAFKDNPNNLPQANHIDEIKTNNNIDNLEWISQADNLRYGTCSIRGSLARERAVFQMDLFGNILNWYRSIEIAQNNTSCSGSSISQCCKGGGKTSKGFTWKYAKAE